MNTISASYRAIESIICKYGREAAVAPVKRADLPSREEINAAVKRGWISQPKPNEHNGLRIYQRQSASDIIRMVEQICQTEPYATSRTISELSGMQGRKATWRLSEVWKMGKLVRHKIRHGYAYRVKEGV
jgi:hypothetical protein